MKTLSWTTSEVTNQGTHERRWFLCLNNEDLDPIATECVFELIGNKATFDIPSQFGIYEAVIRLAEEARVELQDIDTSNTIGKLAEIRHDIVKKMTEVNNAA